MGKKDTTTKLQTKNWGFMTVRIPHEIKEQIRKDAKKNMRPIGMHLSFIIQEYFKGINNEQ
tara:strand:+ start:12 stop:194 length:183 start_codon:yes stop_codon:yes gene_type:complete